MANKLFVLTVSLGVLTTFLSILALSLNYWQGRTLLYKELLSFGGTENKGGREAGREGDRDEGGDVKFSTVEEDESETTPRSISALGNMVLTEKSSTESRWMNAVMNVHAGIWYSCIKVIELPGSPGFVLPEECMYLENIPDLYMPAENKFVVWIRADWAAPRTLLFLGMFCMIACIVCVVLRWYIMTDKVVLLFVAAGLSFIAGLFFLAGFSVFADTMKLDILSYQSAFYFCIFAWLLAWATGGLIIYTRVSNKDILSIL